MKLFEINQEIYTVQELLNEWASDHDGDITGFPLNEELEKIEESRESKLLSIACVIKDYEGDADSIDSEIKRLMERKKSLQSKADKVRNWLEANVKTGEKLSDSRAQISWRKSKFVDVQIEANVLPIEFQKIKIDADKMAIKVALSNGQDVLGCALIERQNMQVK